MALQILNAGPDPEKIVGQIRSAIEAALPGAEIEVCAASPGHFEISVTSEAFAGQSRLQQQQRVYAAIAHLMKGDAAPVHAIDRMQTRVP